MSTRAPVSTVSKEFSETALEYLDALYGYAMALTHNRVEAEDLVQETYLRAVRAFGQLVPDSNLKSWMFAILRNVWLNELRHARSGPTFVGLDGEEGKPIAASMAELDDPYAVLARKVERERLQTAINQLPGHHREVIVLREIEGFSYQQIATILDCPTGTVMSRLGRARDHLRTILKELRFRTAS